jgi:hypothetical protein
MLYYNRSLNKKIFHIHIPRTGGRYIREIFQRNNYESHFNEYKIDFCGIEIPHLHYPLYLELNHIEESDHFTVVRNPFEKFKSALQLTIKVREYSEEIYEKIKDKDWLFEFLDLEKKKHSYSTNFFRNQKDFISEKTKIWKIENELDEEYIKWLNSNFNISLKKLNNIKYQKTTEELLSSEKDICPSVENLIKEYYDEDYDFFNY